MTEPAVWKSHIHCVVRPIPTVLICRSFFQLYLVLLLVQSDQRYETGGEVRGQLRFLEELDKLEKKRHEEAEREVLLRAAKVRKLERSSCCDLQETDT